MAGTQWRRKYRTKRKTPKNNKAEHPKPRTAPRKKPLQIQLLLPWNARLTPPNKVAMPHRRKQTPALQWHVFDLVMFSGYDPSLATRPTGRVDCNRSAMAGFAA